MVRFIVGAVAGLGIAFLSTTFGEEVPSQIGCDRVTQAIGYDVETEKWNECVARYPFYGSAARD